MDDSLQSAFVRTLGKPVVRGDRYVQQMDVIPIESGDIEIRFAGGLPVDQGIQLKSPKGWIELSDGERPSVVNVWRSPGLPDVVRHRVSSPDGQLQVSNIYRVRHQDGSVTEERFTGNAGMIVTKLDSKRLYECSDGAGSFCASDLVVEISWRHK